MGKSLVIVESPSKATIINRYLGDDYVPKDLTAINSNYSNGKKLMTKEAAEAFNKLASAAKGEGYNVRAVSTYRSYTYQNDLF